MTNREDISYLINADASEFDLLDAVEAEIALAEALEDVSFQLNDVPKAKFKGDDYSKWRTSASYKKNRISTAYRAFRKRVQMLLIEKKENGLVQLIDLVLKGDPDAIEKATKLVNES